MENETRQKLEAIIRYEAENMPYKYREIRAMLLYGVPPLKDWTKEEIDKYFADCELEITSEDKEWVNGTKMINYDQDTDINEDDRKALTEEENEVLDEYITEIRELKEGEGFNTKTI